MRGDGFCRESPDDGGNDEHPYHCIHLRVHKRDLICCFCGLLFEAADLFHDAGEHGRYRPKRGRPLGSRDKTPRKRPTPRRPIVPVYGKPRIPTGPEEG